MQYFVVIVPRLGIIMYKFIHFLIVFFIAQVSVQIALETGPKGSNAWAMGEQRSFPELEVVKNFEINQYMGKWYEVARLPQYFEKNCVGVTAEYSLNSSGKVDVKNTCRKVSCEGQVSESKGAARVVDPKEPSVLKVSFFWPFEGDYRVLELPADYSYAVVGSNDRTYFWILSRTPILSPKLIQEILGRFQLKGFDFNHVIMTQPCES